MRVLSLHCRGYRNLQDVFFEPGPGVNVIWGQNAQGKTNLLEALWLFTGGRSFRGTKDSELVMHGTDKAELKLCFFSEEREQTAAVSIADGRRKAELNGIPLPSPGRLVGHIGAVIFSPEHVALVRGGPADRRVFLDTALCQIRPGYVRLLNRYQHTLSQRNALLKDIPRHRELEDTLPIWDARLVSDGETIVRARRRYLEHLAQEASKIYDGLSRGQEKLCLSYLCTANDFSASLRQERERDIRQGFTGTGPHRDDMEILLDGCAARSCGSQGQKRSIVLSLKLAEAKILEAVSKEKPAVLLDDVLSELDNSRQDYLLNHLSGCQVFITCCEPAQVQLLQVGKLFHTEAGTVIPGAPEE